MVYLSLFCGVIYMLCIINCQYTHNQGKFCQNFQFFHIYTSFSVNLHHFTVTKPKFRSKSPKFRSECNEILFFKFKITFRSKLPKFSEISPEIPFPVIGGIRKKNEKVNRLPHGTLHNPYASYSSYTIYPAGTTSMHAAQFHAGSLQEKAN